MIIIRINGVFGYASTGRTIREIAEFTTILGHSDFTFISEGISTPPYSERYISDAERNIHAILSRITGLQGYFSLVPTIRLLKKISRVKPDIIHLHVLHGNSICLPMLFYYLKIHHIPVVVTLDDCWLFTGKCSNPTPYQCDQYTKDCAHCPAKNDINPSWFFVPAKKMHKDRQKWFQGLYDYRVVGVSDWVSGLARASFLSSEKISTIYNWIDERTFYPRDSSEIKQALKIAGKRVLLGVASVWSIQKGLMDFVEISEQLPDTFCIVLVGKMPKTFVPSRKFICVDAITSTEQLAAYYSMADIFVNPSQYETFGKTSAESLMCGTPVIAYANTATVEVVAPDCGILVNPSSGVNGLIEAIHTLLQKSKDSYTLSCIAHAKTHFCMDNNILQYLSLYEDLMEKQSNS